MKSLLYNCFINRKICVNNYDNAIELITPYYKKYQYWYIVCENEDETYDVYEIERTEDFLEEVLNNAEKLIWYEKYDCNYEIFVEGYVIKKGE